MARPSDLSLAHRGVLFLDELPEFGHQVLEVLRQPLEDGVVVIARARGTVAFPAKLMLVGAMNPCPCGEGALSGACRCSDAARSRYARRLSGPLLDRFDLRVPVARPEVTQLLGGPPGETTAAVAERVSAARALAAERGVRANAELTPRRLDEVGSLSPAAARVLEWRLRTGDLSGRGLHRVRRVARTLADLDGAPAVVGEEHVCAALEPRAERSAPQAA